MPKKVLIIDDEVDTCHLLQMHLEKKNCEVAAVHTMADGIKKLEEDTPDLVLLDNQLPDGRGWAMAAKMAKVFPEMKIVLLTGHEPPLYPLTLGLELTKLEKPLQLAQIDELIG